MAKTNFEKWRDAYEAGLPIREQITNYSPMDMKNAIGNIVNFARLTCASKMKDCENMSEKGVLDLKYGSEKNQEEPDLISFDFILKEAKLSYGCYDIYEVRIDCLGIFVTYKEEHRQMENIISLYWDDYEKLKEQNLVIFP